MPPVVDPEENGNRLLTPKKCKLLSALPLHNNMNYGAIK